MPFFDLRNLFGAGGADPWVNAAQLAAAIASEGEPESNVDPAARIAIENLARVAELHVGQATGLALPSNTTVVPVTRTEWTKRSLTTYRPFFERFGEAVGTGIAGPGGELSTTDPSDPLAAMLGQVFTSMGPMLVSLSAGSMLGHLGQRALGQYDLPVPRDSTEVLVVPATIDAAARGVGRTIRRSPPVGSAARTDGACGVVGSPCEETPAQSPDRFRLGVPPPTRRPSRSTSRASATCPICLICPTCRTLAT